MRDDDSVKALSQTWDREYHVAMRVAEAIAEGVGGTEHLVRTFDVYGRTVGSAFTLFEVMEASPASTGIPIPLADGQLEPSEDQLAATSGVAVGCGTDVYSYMSVSAAAGRVRAQEGWGGGKLVAGRG
jgi:hypothetical protein